VWFRKQGTLEHRDPTLDMLKFPQMESFMSREDKGDREGIPHTNPIP